MQMIQSSVRFACALAGTFAAFLGIAAMATPASAQGFGDNGSVRLGIYVPTNINTSRPYSNTFYEGGLDIDFMKHESGVRNIVSVDYIKKTNGDRSFQMIPLTIGTENIASPRGNGVRPFAGFGAGLYFVNLKDNGNANFGSDGKYNTTTYGGYVQAGLELPSDLIVDLRYHLIQPVHNVSLEGAELTVGLKF